MILVSHGFDAVCVPSMEEGRRVWNPDTYALVLVNVQPDADAALEFCEELKERDPQQLVAMMSAHHVYVPPSTCPDDVIDPGEGPRRFVAQIKQLLEPELTASESTMVSG
jgi:hypothetical protein